MLQSSRRKLSVLVVSWNQAERLERCLTAVREALPDAQVVVVDNGSSPALKPLADVLLRSEQNLGYAGGNNLGIEHCTGEFILLLNNDALLPSAQPIATLIAFLECHPRVAAAQATMVLPDGTLETCGEFLNWMGLLTHAYYKRPATYAPRQPYPIFAGKGACLLLRRSALDDVGGLFRPSYFCYYEDIDLCHRLWLAGHEVWFVPTETVLHEEKASSRLLPQRTVWRHYLTNMLTSAQELWGKRLWLTRGLPFLGALVVGGLLKGTRPQLRRDPIPFKRVRSDKELLAYVTPAAHRRFLRRHASDKG